MLKADAQKRFRGTVLGWATVGMAAGGALCLAPRSPFMTFFAIFLAAGAIVTGISDLLARTGHTRTAGVTVIVLGALFVFSGVMIFAPQPLWVGMVLVTVGALTTSRIQS
jgi:uncharacterized membrane protein HdeD (DUF308 family)